LTGVIPDEGNMLGNNQHMQHIYHMLPLFFHFSLDITQRQAIGLDQSPD